MDGILISSAPLLVAVFLIVINYKLVATPSSVERVEAKMTNELEKAKAEMMEKVEQRFVTLKQFEEMKKGMDEHYSDLKVKMNDIYNILIKERN